MVVVATVAVEGEERAAADLEVAAKEMVEEDSAADWVAAG